MSMKFLQYHADENDANDHPGIQDRGTLAAVSAAAEALASATDSETILKYSPSNIHCVVQIAMTRMTMMLMRQVALKTMRPC